MSVHPEIGLWMETGVRKSDCLEIRKREYFFWLPVSGILGDKFSESLCKAAKC
jgi:hypothetical protein